MERLVIENNRISRILGEARRVTADVGRSYSENYVQQQIYSVEK